jgi:DNA-binding NtrC family response regulator
MVSPSPSAFPPVQTSRARGRTVLIASSDSSQRERLRLALSNLRWQVLEAPGGAEAWLASQSAQLDAMLIDPWLPDLDVAEFLTDFHRQHPQVDLVMTDGVAAPDSPRSPYHQELLYALRRSQDGDTAAWNLAPVMHPDTEPGRLARPLPSASRLGSTPLSANRSSHLPGPATAHPWTPVGANGSASGSVAGASSHVLNAAGSAGIASRSSAAVTPAEETPEAGAQIASDALPDFAVAGAENGFAPGRESLARPALLRRETPPAERIPELIGSSPAMLEVSRRIRLVAARTTPVLIEGPTGSGKELVAEALHRLSNRNRKPFVAINCAAIPEALLEAELFGHTRGAFTGAVQGRTGRIEAADGGTLFLDEIGEMPLGLQSKLLRFFESGELQRIGDNETVKVDVRIVAATHQPLAEDAQKGLFRADLYYRLAVFLIRTPALIEHMQDLPQLVAHFLERLGRRAPVKRIEPAALELLGQHSWPGNVRELEHVLERAAILAGDEPAITPLEIDFGFPVAN